MKAKKLQIVIYALSLVIGLWLIGAGYMLAVASPDYTKVVLGGLAGLGLFAVMGGVGVAAMGTAVGLGAGTFAAVGSFIGYGFVSDRDYDVWEWLPPLLMGVVLVFWSIKRLAGSWKNYRSVTLSDESPTSD